MIRRDVKVGIIAAVLLALIVAASTVLPTSAQSPGSYNEREIISSGTLNDDPKSDIWTFDFRFKDPRVIKVNVPGRGTRLCWYMWFQVINRTKEPRNFFPEFELVTHDPPASYFDENLTTVEDAIRKVEDPTGYQEIKSTATIIANPIPVSLSPDKAFPKAVTGIAIWDGTSGDPKTRDKKVRDLGDSQQFSIYISGLSNASSKAEPIGKGKAVEPIIHRKTLQLNYRRIGDRYSFDSRDIVFVSSEWIYRAVRLPRLPGNPQILPPGKDDKK